MELEKIFLLALMGILHLILAGMLLDDLVNRDKILGPKIIWAVIIPLFILIGPLLYLVCHPGIFYGKDNQTRS